MGTIRSVAIDNVHTRVSVDYDFEGELDNCNPCEGLLDSISLALELCEPHADGFLAPDVDNIFSLDRLIQVDFLSPVSLKVVFKDFPGHFRSIAVGIVSH